MKDSARADRVSLALPASSFRVCVYVCVCVCAGGAVKLKRDPSLSMCLALFSHSFVSLSFAFKHLSRQEYLAGGGSVSNLQRDFFHPTQSEQKDGKSPFFFLFLPFLS